MRAYPLRFLAFTLAFLWSLPPALARTPDSPLPAIAEFDHLDPHGFDWMLAYDNKSTSGLVKDPQFAKLNDRVVSALKVQYDFDGPGTRILLRDKFLEVLGGTGAGPSTPDPVKVRLGRYLIASNCQGDSCRTRALLWVDTVEGIALCALVHPSTPELPSKGPAVLIYSRQLSMKMKLVKEAFLPDQFWFDFRDWAYNKQLPLVMTQRYVNGFNVVQVLLHDQEFCRNAYSTRDAEICNQDGQDAADADLQALTSQIRSRLTEDTTGATLLTETAEAWGNYRDKACKAAYNQFQGGTGAPVASGQCSVRLTRERVRDLQAAYWMMLFD